MKTVTVKLTGAAAALAGTRSAVIILENADTYRDLIIKLAETLPALINLVIDSTGKDMLSSNFFQLSEQEFIMPGMWERQPQDGAEIILISPITGG